MRKRPGMYIGSTGARGLHHLIYEVVDNAVDEALAGEADAVEIVIHPDNSVTVTDNGRGIPVGTMEKEGRPAAEVVLTVLHAGGKFGEGGGYKVSGGLHGVGVSVVNALSERLALTIWREGHEWTQPYERGAPDERAREGREVGRARHPDHLPARPRDLRDDRLRPHGARAALPRDGVPHARASRSTSATSAASASRRASSTTAASSTSSSTCTRRARASRSIPKIVYVEETSDVGEVEVALQWNNSYQEALLSFANNINTHEGGTHLSGFRSALTRTINNYAPARPGSSRRRT